MEALLEVLSQKKYINKSFLKRGESETIESLTNFSKGCKKFFNEEYKSLHSSLYIYLDLFAIPLLSRNF